MFGLVRTISARLSRAWRSRKSWNPLSLNPGLLKLSIILILLANHGLAEQFGDFTYTASTTSISIAGYTGAGGAVVIPGTINGLPVVTIAHHSFMNKGTITSVTIPGSVTRIEYQAFQSCGKLASVNIPAGVTHIGNVAFQGCGSLTSISLPSSVTSIGFGPFANCAKLPLISVDALNPSYCSVNGVLLNKSQTLIVQCPAGKTGGYVIPSSVIDVGDLAFQNSSLTSVAIGSGITSIGLGTFTGCPYLTSVVIPASVTSVKGDSFRGCSSLSSITVDAGNPVYSSLNGVVFNKNRTNLVIYPCGIAGTYAIPNTVISIGVNAFSGCYKLTGIIIPTSVTTIGEWSFSSCSGLAALNMPSSITGIGSGAFAYCTSLTSVAISGNVTKLGTPVTSDIGFTPHPAFPGCSKLMSITVDASNPFYSSVNGVLFNKTQTELLNYPGGKAGSYEIPAGVTNIANSAFAYDPKLTQVVIPKSVSNIEGSAFAACEALVSATFKGNAPTMVTGVFYRNASTFTVYYLNGSIGFTSPTWMGYPAVGVFATSAVAKVRTCQIPGTHRVKITYDLDSNSPTVISVQAWTEGSTNYGAGVQAAAFTGDIGPNVASGSEKTIEFDAAKTTGLKNIFTKDLRFKVIASAAPQQSVGNVSNLTLLDTENPAIRDLAVIAGDASNDGGQSYLIYDELHPRNQLGVFFSEGPLLKRAGINEYVFNMLFPWQGKDSWTNDDFLHSSVGPKSMFFMNDQRYQRLPDRVVLPWKVAHGSINDWTLRWNESYHLKFTSSLNAPSKPVSLYKRFEFPKVLNYANGGSDPEKDRKEMLIPEIINNAKRLKLVVVVHGWNTEPRLDPYTTEDWPHLLAMLSGKLGDTANPVPGWDLYAYRWGQDSYTGNLDGNEGEAGDIVNLEEANAHANGGVGLGQENGTQAAEIGYQHGLILGKLIWDHCQDNGISLEKVQFVAHSAGTWVARSASLFLQSKYNASLQQQITLLDPYNPHAGYHEWSDDDKLNWYGGEDSVLRTAHIDNWAVKVNSVFSENIFSKDYRIAGTNENNYWTSTGLASGRYVNEQVGESDIGMEDKKKWGAHGGPIRFFDFSLDPEAYAASLPPLIQEGEMVVPMTEFDLLRYNSSTAVHVANSGWEKSMFMQEYYEKYPRKLVSGGFYSNVSAASIPPSSLTGPQYAPAPPASSSLWQQILVDVDSVGWVRAMLLPTAGGAAELAGPVRPEPDGTFSITLKNGSVFSGAFDTTELPATVSLAIDGVPYGQKSAKSEGSNPHAGVDAVELADGKVLISLVLPDGTAGVVVRRDGENTGWEGAGSGLVDDQGNFNVSGGDEFQASGQFADGGGMFADSVAIVPPQVPEIHVTTADGSALVSGLSSKDFGTTVTGKASAKYVVTIRNTGAVPLTGLGLSLVGSHPGDFTATGLAGSTLQPDESVAIDLVFRPQAVGPRTAVLQIASNDTNESPFDIALGGTGTVPLVPEVAIEHPAGTNLVDGSAKLAFGNQVVGKSANKTIIIRNTGNANLTGLVVTRSGTNASNFVAGALGSNSLAPGGQTTFTVTFTPSALGSQSAAIHIASNDANENPFDISLTGTGVAPEISVFHPVDVSLKDGSAAIAFGGMSVGGTTNKIFTIKNTGSAVLLNLKTAVNGVNAADFTFTTPLKTSLASGESTTFSVVFKPLAIGTRQAAIHISSNDADENPFDISLTGTGVAPEISVFHPVDVSLKDGSAAIAFGGISVGGTANKSFTIKNTGSAVLLNLKPAINGVNAADFTFTTPLKTSLASGESTSFSVAFKPSAIGTRQAAIHIASNDADENPFDISLNGTGLDPEIAITGPGGINLKDGKSSIDLGGVKVGKSGIMKTFVIHNRGNALLKGIAVSKSGRHAKDIVITPPKRKAIGPGKTTTFTVRFKPSASGTRNAFIHVLSTDRNERSFDIRFTGKGIKSPKPADSLASVVLDGLGAAAKPKILLGDTHVQGTITLANGRKYRTLTLEEAPGTRATVEVSSNLVDWFSGPVHTTILQDDETFLKVRDNTPITPLDKRFIRLKPPVP